MIKKLLLCLVLSTLLFLFLSNPASRYEPSREGFKIATVTKKL